MKREILKIQNLKCRGCETSVRKKLESIAGVSNVHVNADMDEVSFDCTEEKILHQVEKQLKSMGYPKEDQSNTLKDQAVSYVSCMIGKGSNLLTEK